jgi:hypothetical protein
MEMIMKSESYLRKVQIKNPSNDWYTVKAGAGSYVAETTTSDAMWIQGEVHDMTVLDPADLLQRFEEYEDPEFDGEEWGIL